MENIVLLILLLLAILYWLATFIAILISTIRVKSLPDQTIGDASAYPMVSIIIPVCNEIDTFEPAFNSLANLDYPKVEFIIVDDRSTDGTSALIDRNANRDSRVRVIHIEKLPEGWLGKVHALKIGAENAKGEFMLFTDADIHFSTTILKKAISQCINEKIDFLTLIPKFENVNIILDTAISFMIRAIFAGNRVWETNDPTSKHAVGFGVFMLVNRIKFDQSHGFEWIKMDICDDLAFGLLMKQAGARCKAMVAANDVSLTYSRSFNEYVRSIEKTGLAYMGKFNFFRAVFVSLFAIILEFIPFVALVFMHQTLVSVLSIISIFIMISSLILMSIWVKRPLLSCLLSPLGITINSILIMHSAWLGARNKGVYWRGTFYPIEELRKGQRI